MKRGNFISLAIIVFYAFGLTNSAYAQSNNNALAKEERNVEAFNALNAGETFIISFTPAETYKVIIETNENKLIQITTKIVNGVLSIKNNNLRTPEVMNVFITAPVLTDIHLSGTSEFYANDAMSVDSIKIESSGASKAELNINANHLNLKLHGASEVLLSGSTNSMEAIINGTSTLNTTALIAKDANIKSYSKSMAHVNVTENLDIASASSSKVSYIGKPKNTIKHQLTNRNDLNQRVFSINNRDGEDEFSSRSRSRLRSSSRSRSSFGRINFSVGEREDSTIVVLGRHQFIIDEYGNARYNKIYRNRFNGNWGGIDLGINGYLTPDFNMDYPEGYDFLDLNFGRSIRFDLNIFEQNIPLSKNKHWGFVTGIGFEFRKYYFDNNITLIGDEDEIMAYTNSGTSIKKNKLTASYVNIPFLFEYQTNAYNDRNSFHISVGMVFGLRYASKTKMVFDKKNTTYDLLDADENIIATVTHDKKRVIERNSFHLNPIKADAMFRIGWGWFNFYATYSATTLFKKNEGPELYPFSFGMTLLKW